MCVFNKSTFEKTLGPCFRYRNYLVEGGRGDAGEVGRRLTFGCYLLSQYATELALVRAS